MKKDITGKVWFCTNDDEYLPIHKCLCGKTFGSWEFVISIYKDTPTTCPSCGAKLYFSNEIRVYQMTEENNELD